MPTDQVAARPRMTDSSAAMTVRETMRMVTQGTYRDLRRPPTRRATSAVPRTRFDPTSPEAIADPFPAMARLREHPVQINEKLNIWMLARHEDVLAATRAHDTLSSASGILMRSAPMQTVVTTDNPDHDRLRRLMSPSFTPSAIRQLESTLREFATPCVESLCRGDVVDLVPALTVPLPVSAIAAMLGVDRSRWQDFRLWSHDVTSLFAARAAADLAVIMGKALPGILSLRKLIADELRLRRSEPSDDILGRLQKALSDGDMTIVEVLAAAMVLLVAGNETTTNLMGILLIQLARNPELFDRLRSDRALIPGAVEEAVRWGSPVQWVARTALAPYRVGSTVIPARSRVVLFYAGANRDPRRFEDPDRFDITRKPLGHIAFGHGAHFCMGAHLARLEVVVALNALFDRIENLELAGPIRWTTTPSLSGPTSLPVRARAA